MSWDHPENRHNKLRQIKPIISEWLPSFRSCRREEIVLARLRIGHTHFTHSFLLKGEEPPQCIPCHTALSIKHIFLDCVDVSHIREKYFEVSSMKELFESVRLESIFEFLREIHIFNKM